jgi:hypothetical protein
MLRLVGRGVMKSLLSTQAKTPTTHLVNTRTELLLLSLYTSNILASHQINHLEWDEFRSVVGNGNQECY